MNHRLLIRYQSLAVFVGILILIGKFIAFYLTESNAILTDALESIINVVAGGFGLFSIVLASKPKDENHPYGHGKIEFISASIEGSLILAAGSVMITKAIYNLFFPMHIHSLHIGLYVSIITGFLNYGMGYGLIRAGKQANSPTLLASGKHLQSDAWSTLGLIIGLSAIMLTNWVWLDQIVTIIFGGLIAYTGYHILRDSVGGIMDEADFQLLSDIIPQLERGRQHNWIDVHNMRIIRYGSDLHMDCHLTLPYYLNVEEAHNEVESFQKILDEICGKRVELFIHVDPCLPKCCSHCIKEDCPVRQHPFQATEEWQLENVLKNRKHGMEGTSDE